MSRKAPSDTPQAIQRRIAEGRGTGHQKDYKHWQETKDISSLGRKHRIYFPKYDSTGHFFSDLERNLGFLGESVECVTDNRTQVPLLPLSETQEIARSLKIRRHPRHPITGCDIVMTTDQVWTITSPRACWLQPISVKPSTEWEKTRVQQKLAIEAEYWKRRACAAPLLRFDETSIGPYFVRNWELVRHTLRSDFFSNLPKNFLKRVCARANRLKSAKLTWSELTRRVAGSLKAERQHVLSCLYWMVATHQWHIDLEGAPIYPSRTPAFIEPQRLPK